MPQPSAGKPLASRDAGSSRIRPRKRLLTLEHGLGLAGLALAVASGSFAGYMISDTGRQPHFSGAEYLTVFAKLTPGGQGSPTTGPRAQRPEPDAADADELATASISRDTASGPIDGLNSPASPRAVAAGALPPGAAATMKAYVLRSVTRGVALIESPEGLREVRLGTVLPYAGLVTSIEQQDGRWVVITSQGVIREARR